MSAFAQVAQSRLAEPAGRLMNWTRQGIETFVAAQSILLDLTAQQNALVIGVIRERVTKPRFNPLGVVAGMADKGVANVTSAGKIILDLAAGESALAVNGVKDVLRLSPVAGTVADVVGHRVDTIFEMYKHVLETAAEQTHAAVESYQDGRGLHVVSHVAEFACRSIEGVVETEKKFLDLVAEEATAVADGEKETRKPARDRVKVMTQLARDGADQLLDAEKKLFDLAISQFERDGKSASQAEVEMEPRTPWAVVTQRGVQNFVTAQKSLLDLAVKPVKASAPSAAPKARKRPGRKAAASKRTR